MEPINVPGARFEPGDAAAGVPPAPASISSDPDVDLKFERVVIRIGIVDLIIEPGRKRTWPEFHTNAPAGSIALDGYVRGLTRFDPNGPWANLNHHEAAQTLATASTTYQTFDHIKAGMLRRFEDRGLNRIRVYVADCDEDVCFAVWLLAHADEFRGGRTNQAIEEMVTFEDRFERFSGAYPCDLGDPRLGRLAWIAQPYRQRRDSKKLNAGEMAEIILETLDRITRYSQGDGETISPLPASYALVSDVLTLPERPSGWVFVTREEMYSRILLSQKHENYVSLIYRHNDSWRYSLGRLRPLSLFPVQEIYRVLNAAEILKGNKITKTNCWGGSQNSGGSPLDTDSLLTPQELTIVLNRFILLSRSGGDASGDVTRFIAQELPTFLDRQIH